jgi:hypothetical protein
MAKAAASEPERGPFGIPMWVVWGGGALIFFLIAFFIGFATGSAPVDQLADRVEQAETRAGQAEAEAATLEAELAAQRSLALLYRAMLDMDARNFGIANERLGQVAAILDLMDPDPLGVDVDAFESLRSDVAAMDVRVAEDLAAQRAAVTALARRLEELVGG